MITPDIKDRGFLMWAAAWLDTEGHIGIRAGVQNAKRSSAVSFRVVVGVTQAVAAPLEILKAAFGGSVSKPKKAVGRKPIYMWSLHSKAAVEFISAVQPYIVVKMAQAKIAIEAGKFISSGIRGRWHKRAKEENSTLLSMKTALNSLNGWNEKRIRKASIVTKRRGPKPMTRWATHFSSCNNCGTTALPHLGKGLCRNCYGRYWRQHTKGIIGNKPVIV